ncbi:MAG: hypothetical protein V4456_16510 [Bacteroidota bacterium]
MKKIFLFALCVFSFCMIATAARNPSDSLKQADSIKKSLCAKTAAPTCKPDSPAPATAPVKPAAGDCKEIDTGYRSLAGWVLIISIVTTFLLIANKSNLLKDAITDESAFLKAAQKMASYAEKGVDDIPRPFSLARSQLGIWTVVIGCSYIYVELCRNYAIGPVAIDKNLLALMGISAATATAGNVIDTSNNEVAHHQDGPSEGFLKDILSDQSGISVHRFQNVIWTFIAVTVYLCQLSDVDCKHLPTLDTNLIALTGISGLTYLGLKVNENKPPLPPVVPPAN